MTTYAAALAYRGLFGLFPFVLLVVALLGVLRADGFFEWLLESVRNRPPVPQVPGSLGPAVDQARSLETLIEQAREQAGSGLLSFGFAVSLWSVYMVARTLSEALNAAYGTEETRPGLKRFLLTAVLGPALALVVIVATTLVLIGSRVAEWLAELVGLDTVFVSLWAWLRLPVALFLLAVVLSVVYRFIPNVSQPYRLVTPGAVLAVIAWAVASLGFSLYLSNFADYGATYGSLGAAVGLLFYLYLSACAVLFGAEVNAAIHRYPPQRGAEKKGPE